METDIVDLASGLEPGLYIVAGPIGNLGDLTPRAAEVLRRADVIAVEDTRVSARLLRHAGSDRPMVPYHDHSAEAVRARLVDRMARESVALLSDAGTPLISDPGYKLVRDARAAGRRITTLPGPSAVIAALTLSGLPTDRFLFMGFLPSKQKARGDTLDEVAALRATLVFYESGPRLSESLAAMAAHLGDRDAAVSREISKAFEETATGTLTGTFRPLCRRPAKGGDRRDRRPAGRGTARQRRGCRRGLAGGDGAASGFQGGRRGRQEARTGPPRALRPRPGTQGVKTQPSGARLAAEKRGRQAERIAGWWLRLKGWQIVGRRMRTPAGEVDLVARRGAMLAFVEVKARARGADLDLAIDERRLSRVAAAAEILFHDLAKPGDDMRIDVILLAPGRPPRHLANVWHGG